MDLEEKQLLVAFGTNQPFDGMAPDKLIEEAVHALTEQLASQVRLSRLYSTPCFPAGAGPDYVNAVGLLTLRHKKSPKKVLQTLHAIETRFGRTRTVRWGARTLDIDLLAMGCAVLPDPQTQARWQNLPPEQQTQIAPEELILPHPRLHERAFVLVPLADVADTWLHPTLGRTVLQMLDALPPKARSEVRRLNPGASS